LISVLGGAGRREDKGEGARGTRCRCLLRKQRE
jgi:hypothetical protein